MDRRIVTHCTQDPVPDVFKVLDPESQRYCFLGFFFGLEEFEYRAGGKNQEVLLCKNPWLMNHQLWLTNFFLLA